MVFFFIFFYLLDIDNEDIDEREQLINDALDSENDDDNIFFSDDITAASIIKNNKLEIEKEIEEIENKKMTEKILKKLKMDEEKLMNMKVPSGTSASQALWLIKAEEDNNSENENENECVEEIDNEKEKESDENMIMEKENLEIEDKKFVSEDDDGMDNIEVLDVEETVSDYFCLIFVYLKQSVLEILLEEEKRTKEERMKLVLEAGKEKSSREYMIQFPDEVITPLDKLAKDRFSFFLFLI
jgi:hypothetical protein